MKDPINQYDENNQFHGYWERKDKKGGIYATSNYFHGVHQGKVRRYWSNGELAHDGYYNKGKADGFWKFFTKEKRLRGKTYYI